MNQAKPKARGSIIYEIVIVVLIGILLATLIYPQRIWDKEAENLAEGRRRMSDILQAELRYLNVYLSYTDSLPGLVEFMKSDSTLLADTLSLAFLDSALHYAPSYLDSTAFDPGVFDSLLVCPTVRRPYVITVDDTSVIKSVTISCPIDSTDIERIKSSFWLSTIGALELENHGKIEKGKKSWE